MTPECELVRPPIVPSLPELLRLIEEMHERAELLEERMSDVETTFERVARLIAEQLPSPAVQRRQDVRTGPDAPQHHTFPAGSPQEGAE